jgi:cell division protease FtsH
MSGADIARLVREARQKARRERRALTHSDLAALLVGSRPARSPSMRRRMAIHECGHVVARLAYDLGAVTLVTIDGRDGHGFVESIVDDALIQTEDRLAGLIRVYLAGRAAELAVCGVALAGSGGSGKSDLARASALAYALEVSLGYGGTMPLLYRDPDDYVTEIRFDPDLAARVNARLEAAHAAVTTLIRSNLDTLHHLAKELIRHGTLEGDELEEVLAEVRKRLAERCMDD